MRSHLLRRGDPGFDDLLWLRALLDEVGGAANVK